MGEKMKNHLAEPGFEFKKPNVGYCGIKLYPAPVHEPSWAERKRSELIQKVESQLIVKNFIIKLVASGIALFASLLGATYFQYVFDLYSPINNLLVGVLSAEIAIIAWYIVSDFYPTDRVFFRVRKARWGLFRYTNKR